MCIMQVMKDLKAYLGSLNTEYLKLHKNYEDLFWLSYMGQNSLSKKRDEALAKRDAFRSNEAILAKLKSFLPVKDKKLARRVGDWINFLERYQTPQEAKALKQKIDKLESKIGKERASRKEGYVDPYTKKFVEASSNKLSAIIRTNSDERIRRACFEARERLATDNLDDYVELIKLRNQYARTLGYQDFYDFKVRRDEGMTKEELFALFDHIYNKTKYALLALRKLERGMKGLRKPWNFAYMMAGNFTQEEEPYFTFETALERWVRSFARLGVNFNGGTLTLDLLDRKGKYNNGFCHWPVLAHSVDGKFVPGSANFTCNVVPGQVGSGSQGAHTLFHEGGHAAHLLNADREEVFFNHEYPPSSTAWDETQSMFMDTIFSSPEWRARYALDKSGNPYPFDLFERKIRKLEYSIPLGMSGILMVANYERAIYEAKNLDKQKVLKIARQTAKKYYDYSEDTLTILNVPHIYSWESSANYQGYGLATLALTQWREYFFKKYGYIVDNKAIAQEMTKVWKLGGSKTFKEFVKLATGKKLSAEPYVKSATMSVGARLRIAKERIARQMKVKQDKKIDLNAKIRLVHGPKLIADNSKGMEQMFAKYSAWLSKQV